MALQGISFIVRIRDEEETLEKSIRSLFTLTIPYEIVLVLHCCTDKSLEIAKQLASENRAVKFITYNYEISRAGYENLATDLESKHSLATYYNYCFSQGKFPWKFKWDADFIATPELLDFLNSKEWKKENAVYSIMAKNSTSNNWEGYLIGCLQGYAKHIFWEVPMYTYNYRKYNLNDNQYITHASELTSMKSYWNTNPWYLTEDSDEARLVAERIEKLTNDFGKEPTGMARGSNPVSGPFYLKIKETSPSYINLYS